MPMRRESHRKEAVGKGRYETVAKRLGKERRPEWQDFLTTDGQLMSRKELMTERPEDRAERRRKVDQMLRERERAFRQVAATGFVR